MNLMMSWKLWQGRTTCGNRGPLLKAMFTKIPGYRYPKREDIGSEI